MYVSLMMDVEDLVSPESDDAARHCAEILTEEGVQATMCVVGEKARLLAKRGRVDVIEALKQHDIGIHTDFHSVHPTITEYLYDKNWEDGVAEAIRRETPGVEAIRNVFGMSPSCWGGPGNTWGPQICGAMAQLGVPAFVYAHTSVPDGNVHRFTGLIAYPGGRALSDGAYHNDEAADARLQLLSENLQKDIQSGRYWQEVFIGHPTRIMHEEFWDGVSFSYGANPPREEWKSARRKSDADYARALSNFRAAIQEIKRMPGIELATIREMNEKLKDVPVRSLSEEDIAGIWPEIEPRLRSMAGWPIVPEGLSMEKIVQVTRDKLSTLERMVFSAAG